LNGYHDTLAELYDTVLGSKDVFDTASEYAFPKSTRNMLHHCGYVAKRNPRRLPDKVRREIGAANGSVVLLTAGGGKDGYPLLRTGIAALARVCESSDLQLVVVPGPEPKLSMDGLSVSMIGMPFVTLCAVLLISIGDTREAGYSSLAIAAVTMRSTS